MTDPDDSREDFDRRLNEARKRRETTGPGNRQTAFGQAFRLSSEMVVGVLVGGFIGWWLDYWLGDGALAFVAVFLSGRCRGHFERGSGGQRDEQAGERRISRDMSWPMWVLRGKNGCSS